MEVQEGPGHGRVPRRDTSRAVGDYKLEEKNKRVTFTDEGMNHVEEPAAQARADQGLALHRRELRVSSTTSPRRLRAHKLYAKDVDYVVQDGKVQIVDEFTGRILYGRRYSEGLHQAIEAKERIKIAQRNRTLATITFQNYFRMYGKLAGMTGTADTEAPGVREDLQPRRRGHPDQPARRARRRWTT